MTEKKKREWTGWMSVFIGNDKKVVWQDAGEGYRYYCYSKKQPIEHFAGGIITSKKVRITEV